MDFLEAILVEVDFLEEASAAEAVEAGRRKNNYLTVYFRFVFK